MRKTNAFTIAIWIVACVSQSAARGETIFPSELEGAKSTEIGSLILALMPDLGEKAVSWARLSEGPVKWVTPGYEAGRTNSGEPLYTRYGIVRTNIAGVSPQILRRGKVELGWTVSYINRSNPKFGVERIDVRPGTPKDVCFGSMHFGCEFEVPLRSLVAASISVKLLCTASGGAESLAAYELTHRKKRSTVMLWSTSGGSGGAGSELSLLLAAKSSAKLCELDNAGSQSDAKTAQSTTVNVEQPVKVLPLDRQVAANAPLVYDQGEANKSAVFNRLNLEVRNCMRSGSVAMLRQGIRDPSRIVSFTVGACGRGITQYMTGVIGRPEPEARAFLTANAYQALDAALAGR